MRIKLFVLGLACLVNFLVMVNTGHAQERISGPWLWMIALTELNQGGQESTNIDSLNDASKGRTTEDHIAKNGANEGDTVSGYKWTPGELPANGDINALLIDIGMTEIADFNDVTSYSVIILESDREQPDVAMGVSSDDSIKVWFNGEVVHNNPMNRGRGNANAFQDTFDVNLNSGSNLLMVKVSERAGGWGMFVGVDAEFALGGTPGSLPVESTGKLVTQWAKMKRAH